VTAELLVFIPPHTGWAKKNRTVFEVT